MKCKGPDGVLGVAMHASSPKGRNDSSIPCMYHYHNETFFGLAKNDYRLGGLKTKKEWSYPTEEDQRENYRRVQHLKQQDGLSVDAQRGQ